MKKYTADNFIALLILLLCGWHVSATALYLLPANPLTAHYQKPVYAYMTPIFAQNWMLFAPEPATYSLKFWFRCQNHRAEWTSWHDPVAALLREHTANRFTYRGKLIYVYQSITRDVLNRYGEEYLKLKSCQGQDCHQQALVSMEGTHELKQAERWARDLCLSMAPQTQKFQFQVVKKFTTNFSQRAVASAQGRIERTLFLDQGVR